MKFQITKYLFILVLFSCNTEENPISYSVSGRVTDQSGAGLEGVEIFHGLSESVLTDDQGYWLVPDLVGQHTITASALDYTFLPLSILVEGSTQSANFVATPVENETQKQIFNWA